MWLLLAFLTAGALAELVDGTVGMGFGVTSASVLLALGLAPAAASASVHTAEVFTTLASGASHVRYGNVDRRALAYLAVPGCVGGAIGAAALASYPTAAVRPFVSAFLLAMGLLIVLRFARARLAAPRPPSPRRMGVIGLVAATFDAIGGGGWGPIATPSLMMSGNTEPRKAVGTVNTAEFFVTATIATTFLLLLGPAFVRWDFVAAVAVGGVLMAPVGAYLASRIPGRALGQFVGMTLVALNARAIAVDVFAADARAASVAALGGLLVALALLALRFPRKRREGPFAPTRGSPIRLI